MIKEGLQEVENVSGHRKLILHRKWLNLLLEKIEPEDVVQFCTHQNFTDWLPFRWHGYKQMTHFLHHAYCLFDIVRKKIFRTRK